MDPFLLAAIAGALVSSLSGFASVLVSRRISITLWPLGISVRPEPKREVPLGERVEVLSRRLRESVDEFDTVIREMTEASEERRAAMVALESQLSALATEELEARRRVEALKGVPMEAADYLAQVVRDANNKEASRARNREFAFFLVGVTVTTIVELGIALLIR